MNRFKQSMLCGYLNLGKNLTSTEIFLGDGLNWAILAQRLGHMVQGLLLCGDWWLVLPYYHICEQKRSFIRILGFYFNRLEGVAWFMG